jgi:aspartyl-tRNA(Asn)/glutamyl-tRNA(Gln) amidotransferase subunit A
MLNLQKLTITEAAKKLADGSLTSVDLVSAELARIAERSEVGAFLKVMTDEALEAARSSDARRAAGKSLGVLDGIPVALKDNLLVEGIQATAGSKMLEGYVASYDATAITKLKEAGAVIIGKANMDEFAMGSSTENSALGVTRNPFDTTKVPGGSSGGSAAAVGDSEALAALGTDTGGSIRQPAAFCGVAGFKPTYGAVSRSGAIAMASSLDQIGPFAKTVRDAAAVFSAIADKDVLDATSANRHADIEGLTATTAESAKGLKIGVPKEYLSDDLAPDIKAGFEKARARFKSLGHEIVEISLPHTNLALAAYYIIMPAEVSSNLARFDGLRYAAIPGVDGDLSSRYLAARGKGFGPETKRRIILGTFVLSSGYYDAYYGKAQSARTLICNDFDEAFKHVDVILSPTTPTSAFKAGEKTSDPVAMYLSDIFTIPANLAGLPALSMSVTNWEDASYGPDNMPVAFQLMGPRFADAKVLELGIRYEEA